MKTLFIPFFETEKDASIEKIAVQMDLFPKHQLEYLLWEKPRIKPEVNFIFAHDQGNFYFKFYVTEPYVRALHLQTNSEVYRDSCVEVFISFGNDERYYNLEFNCAGTCLGQFGLDKENRVFLPADVLDKIETYSHIEKTRNEDLHFWELMIKIPISVFIHHNQTSIHQNTLRLNFYKCGDDLEEKHYMAWSEIQSSLPNFHLPAFFGTGSLELPPTC